MTETARTPDLLPVEAQDTLPADPERVGDIAAAINLDDPAVTLTYGARTMTEISRFADDLLGRVRARDAGPVGETLTDLLVKVKDLDVKDLAESKSGFLEKIPFVGALFNTVDRTMARFNTLAGQIEIITAKLDEAMVGLLKDIEVLEQLYEHNRAFHADLGVFVEAGALRLDKARREELPALRKEAEESGDPMAAQRVRDFAEKINRFERRIHDLQLSRTITVQTAPQIRLIQSNNQTLSEKIQTSILTTIPIWKSQMVLALSLHGQRGAAHLQKKVSDTTNELLRKNAEMLESATVETAREVERSVVDIETLREVQQRLISSIEQTIGIAEEGRAKRRAVEAELKGMEDELREKLTALATDKAQRTLRQAEGGPALEEGEK